METRFHSGCVAWLGPLPSLSLIFFSPVMGWGLSSQIPFELEGMSWSLVDKASGASRAKILTPPIPSWSGCPPSVALTPARLPGRRLITHACYLLVSQTSYLGLKHSGKHIRPNRPGAWAPEPFDKHLRASPGHGGCTQRGLLCAPQSSCPQSLPAPQPMPPRSTFRS